MLPMIDNKAALYQLKPNMKIPTGMAPLSSITGKVEMITTIHSGEMLCFFNHSTVFALKPVAACRDTVKRHSATTVSRILCFRFNPLFDFGQKACIQIICQPFNATHGFSFVHRTC